MLPWDLEGGGGGGGCPYFLFQLGDEIVKFLVYHKL